ncbi:MAG TPA: two-component regulator propeller domain-containing protein [Chitinophagaceae bacterium]|nr:two-component regulator propeller domain-containing protein [Chitinophagaceae bacterium]
MKTVRTLLTILAVCWGMSRGWCQSSWRIDKITTADGLSQGYIYAIHQDKKGFIWIGTHGGLNRYDGYGFKVFQYLPFDANSLGDNSVFFLKEDTATGKFWIGGSSCLNEFDPQTFKNTRYRYTDRQMEFADGIFVNKEEILLACEYDVLLFNTRTRRFVKIPVYDENNKECVISRVENAYTDRKGNHMIMSKTGVFFYDPITRTCNRKTPAGPDFSAFYQYETFNVLHDSRGYYWIATNRNGLVRFEPATRTITKLPLPAHLQNETLRFDVVTEDSQGNIWAGSSNGLFKIHATTLASEYYSTGSQSNALTHPEINVIREDRDHFMWIGTVGGGINKMVPQNAGFKNLFISSDKAGNSAGTYIMGLQQSGNDIWFINIWDQVGKVDLVTGNTTVLPKQALPAGYSWYSEGAIIKDQHGNLALVNGETMYRIGHKGPARGQVTSPPAPGVLYIYRSRNGRSYYMVKMKAPLQKVFCRNDTIYGNHFFYDAQEDDKGNIWIGSSKGLLRFNTKDNSIVQYQHNDKDPKSISSDFIYGVELDNANENVWMAAYNGGLCSYNIASGAFRHYTKEDGLPDNIVYAIEKDDHGNVWFTTNAGITTYNTTTKTFRSYGKADGLLNNEFNRRSSCKNEAGWIFFGGIFGIDYFHPDSVTAMSSAGPNLPRLAFTDFRVLNTTVVPGNSDDRPVLELSHGNRYLSVEFAALNYYDQQKIQYAYRLGDSKEWIRLGTRRLISFTDWSPGTHRLHIRSTDGEGIWMNNEIACTIIIHPPWWQTWWFRSAMVVLALGLMLWAIRSYYRRKLQKQRMSFEKQKAVEQERTRIAMEMHDDLGSGLTSIRYLAEGLTADAPVQAKSTAAKIVSSAKMLVDNMNDIIWTMKSDNNTLEETLGYIRKQAADQLENAGIDYSFEFPKTIRAVKLSNEQKRNLLLISKEVVHNIVKHANASHVNIRAVLNDDGLQLTIADNGKGFDPVALPLIGNGLRNIGKRAGEINARLEITRSAGTIVSVQVALLTQTGDAGWWY